MFSRLNLQIFTLTRGSNGATFFYRDNGKTTSLNKKPKLIAPLVDPTGAGDAFHAMLLIAFHRKLYNKEKIDEKYLNNAFKMANALSRQVVQIEGARGDQRTLLKYMLDELSPEELCI